MLTKAILRIILLDNQFKALVRWIKTVDAKSYGISCAYREVGKVRATARRVPDGSLRAHDKGWTRVSCDEKICVSNQGIKVPKRVWKVFPNQGGTADAVNYPSLTTYSSTLSFFYTLNSLGICQAERKIKN